MPTTYAIIQGNKYMDATTYSGTGAAANVTNTAGFYPDLTWVKNRSSGTYWNVLFDSVRGAGNQLSSNQTDAELASASNVAGKVSAFNSNGFGLAAGSSSILSVNGTSNNYVGWQWQAGQGSNVTNNVGSISSQVSVNTTAGFSIVTYTGTATQATVGHGLGTTPSLIIVKGRTNTADWQVYHSALGINYTTLLNSNAVPANIANYWGASNPTSSVFGITGSYSGVNGSGINYVAYCWTAIPGFSQFGSYTGNGSADGPFIYTGFRPKFLLIKRTDVAQSWQITDSSRDPYNVATNALFPNTSAAEDTGYLFDLLSNGFKIREAGNNVNANGGNYIYAVFAETPFKYANAR